MIHEEEEAKAGMNGTPKLQRQKSDSDLVFEKLSKTGVSSTSAMLFKKDSKELKDPNLKQIADDIDAIFNQKKKPLSSQNTIESKTSQENIMVDEEEDKSSYKR
mmetsp:Transcript_29668/g.27127  ORF Transcript_29668/g.27127 Transcript_29668/m.27127 type:complete len:104 (-) Transcript_29668:198-509(-)